MKSENITARPETRQNVVVALAIFGIAAIPASLYVAWPALAHLGGKLL
ncbi:MAG TPA: hypothetical protein VGA63_05005 [Geopsychrobacteraceae bacterium]|jgi:hypothetical protein